MTVDSPPLRSPSLTVRGLMLLALMATTCVYWPSLSGGFVFDDYANILDNAAVHLTSLDWRSVRGAILASPSAGLIRPLAMLTFAANWYVGGANPLPMKVTNLAIHLVNGLLLFALLRSLARLAQRPNERPAKVNADFLAALVAFAWLLAPINFTAVAYIVQRMESLCQTFVLAGLWAYVVARRHMIERGSNAAPAWLAILLGTALGGLAKESAALLPGYAFIVELTILRFQGPKAGSDRRVQALFALLVLPALAGAYWIWRHELSASAWTNSPFTLAERTLTEPRVLIDYVCWSLLPLPNALALYHDQIALSHGLLTPPSTLLSIVVLAGFGLAAAISAPGSPLVATGVLWFLAAHLLTATVIPLELVFEHRNYFASAGLYLAAFSLLLPASDAALKLARNVACAAMLVLFASVTWIRAMDWHDPLMFAISEAEKNPGSPRTAYELGRTYVVLSRYQPDSPFVLKAYATLEHAATMPGADALADQALLLLSARLHRDVPGNLWLRLQHKLSSQPLSWQNVAALYGLTNCAIDGDCIFSQEDMARCFVAALRTPPDTRVLAAYSVYAFKVLGNTTLAIELARSSVQIAPRDRNMRQYLWRLLAISGQRDEADQFYRETLSILPQIADDPEFHEPPPPDNGAPVPIMR